MSVKRSYSSTKRQAQARDTRRSILDAALELFVASGYAATTIQAIAERAGVAVQTVYAVFGTKRDLLRQLIESHDRRRRRVPADHGAARGTVGRRRTRPPSTGRTRRRLDPVDRRARGPIVRVAEEAAASDPELAAMMEAVKAARQHEMIASANILAGPDGLRVNPRRPPPLSTCSAAPRSRTC